MLRSKLTKGCERVIVKAQVGCSALSHIRWSPLVRGFGISSRCTGGAIRRPVQTSTDSDERLRRVRSTRSRKVPVRSSRRRGSVQPSDLGEAIPEHHRRVVAAHKRLKELRAEVEDFTPEERARYDDLVSRAMSPQEIMALPDEPITELLGPLARRGQRIMLGAPPGHGKTTMALQMVNAILFGQEFLGFTGVGDCRALILDAEQSERTLKRRIAEAGLEDVPDDIMKILPAPQGLAFDKSTADRIAIETELAQSLYDIVVFDPFYMLHEGNSNDERKAVDLMKVLDGWRRDYDFALLMPAHTRKRGAHYRFTMDDFFGSSEAHRNADITLGLLKKRYGEARLYMFKDRDGELQDMFKDEPWGLRFTRGEGFERGELSDARKDRSRDSLTKIEDALKRQPWSDVYRLAEMTGLSRSTVDRLIPDLNPQVTTRGKRKMYALDGA